MVLVVMFYSCPECIFKDLSQDIFEMDRNVAVEGRMSKSVDYEEAEHTERLRRRLHR